jgi:hypothetical protein
VRLQVRSWQFVCALTLACLVISGAMYGYFSRAPSTPGELASLLPVKDATILYIDVDSIRRSGVLNMLAGSKAAEELEYRQFVERTNFDYRHDLDAIAASFKNDQIFFALRGRFDWQKLRAYAVKQGGSCRGVYCSVDGSRPGRKISFYRVQSNVMALAVSADDMAAYQITTGAGKMAPVEPTEPVWILAPASALRDARSLPAGTRTFVTALVGSSAERLLFSIGPREDHLLLSLTVTCQTTEAASALLIQLESATSTLRKWLAREKQQANPADLSGVLAAGAFNRDDRRVYRRWPLQRAFVESITGASY